jgi:NADPH:quinone reductase-like Zn-dependent oxidoreductase
MYTIQLATLAGYEVITTASSKNESLLKSLGAKHVVDYSSSTVVEEINRFNNGTLKYAVDCISKGHSTPTAAKCLIDKGGQIANVLPVDQSDIGNNVQVHFFLLYQISGKEITYGPAYFPPSAEDKAWGEEWAAKFSKLICEHKVKPNPVKVLGGLDAVPGGLQYMREGKVHAQKLVYEVDHE